MSTKKDDGVGGGENKEGGKGGEGDTGGKGLTMKEKGVSHVHYTNASPLNINLPNINV